MGGEAVPMEVTNAGRVDSVSKVSYTRVSHLGRSKSASDRYLELTKSRPSIKQLQMHLHQENSFSAGEGDWLSFQYFYLLGIDIFLLRYLLYQVIYNFFINASVIGYKMGQKQMQVCFLLEQQMKNSQNPACSYFVCMFMQLLCEKCYKHLLTTQTGNYFLFLHPSNEVSITFFCRYKLNFSIDIIVSLMVHRTTAYRSVWAVHTSHRYLVATLVQIDKVNHISLNIVFIRKQLGNHWFNYSFFMFVINLEIMYSQSTKIGGATHKINHRCITTWINWEWTLKDRYHKSSLLLTGSNIGLSSCQPLVFFGLCTGASSDPMLNLSLALSFVPVVGITTRQLAGDLDLPLWLSGGAKTWSISNDCRLDLQLVPN
ncbi:unnamed protein product [Musa hybrid cultivar]